MRRGAWSGCAATKRSTAKRGKKVYGKARHRDAVRSSHSYTALRYGHTWIVLAMLVELPYCNRPFALPILVALYRDKKTNAREGRRHKTPVELMCGLLAPLIRWFPERTWRFAGDGGTRPIEVVTGSGNWFRSGYGLVPVAWVHVRDLSGTHREKYFFTTDVMMSAKAIVETYGARWNIETTFQEMRSHLGLETTRGWSRQMVLRMAPCWFASYTIVVVCHDALRAQRNATPLIQWNGKQHVAFADTIAQVRRYLRQARVFQHVARRPPSPKTTARDAKTVTLRTLPSSMRMEKAELTGRHGVT